VDQCRASVAIDPLALIVRSAMLERSGQRGGNAIETAWRRAGLHADKACYAAHRVG
jgi:hypothetical protein